MKAGYLSQYFTRVAIKELTAVEVNLGTSNQHEFNGVNSLRVLFGESRRTFNAKFMYLTDQGDPIIDNGFLTWYNAREGKPRSAEYRLYFPKTHVSSLANIGDLLVVGLQSDGKILTIIAEKDSTIATQLMWLFGFEHTLQRFSLSEEFDYKDTQIAFTSNLILEHIGIQVEIIEETFLDGMLSKFGNEFPSTAEFSDYARSTLPSVSAWDDPDVALMEWIEREEVLFKTFEKHLLMARLARGFADDVDGFLAYSLSVHNRRKSRVGYALENHLEQIWKELEITYSRNRISEKASRPDFIFPGIEKYRDPLFPIDLLTMLGVKSTCKDRWRQVLAEADRIENKHLFTLEAAISENQTFQMKANKLQLIVPKGIQETYTIRQRDNLLDLAAFIDLVKDRQRFYLSN